MPDRFLDEMIAPLGERSRTAHEWAEFVTEAFDDGERNSGLLQLAERALRAYPGDALLLLLTATAAVLEEHPEQTLIFLKRYSKRYEPNETYHLLRALAMAERKQFTAARNVLARNELDWHPLAFRAFPGGPTRSQWLMGKLRAILNPARPAAPREARSIERTRETARLSPAPSPKPDTPQVLPLPSIDIGVPVRTEIDLSRMIAGMNDEPEADGAWYRLRERHAHLGLAQGFDELLCLPHLHAIQTLRHQTETARKVLGQFSGRVLLADEVGLGKTIEAAIVLKEYVLRGMVETVLVLTPASLVGQWREELETKFDIRCSTTHDALLRSDPDRFWREQRLIASLATARRAEHAERLLARGFDLVIVDEAHHLHDRASLGYKLVDKIKKRFLLLLSATPVQNDLTELYNVLTLLKPGIFKTLKEFRAAYTTPGKPREPANPARLRELMRGAMIRNTRAVVTLNLPRRQANTVQAEGSKAEHDAYQDLVAAVRRIVAESASGSYLFAIRHLLGAAGSSPSAARAAVERFAARHHANDPVWAQIGSQWAGVGIGAKEDALLELLRRNPAEKKLVFVHYRETLENLADLLNREGIAFARFEGTLSGTQKDAVVREFRDYAPVLLSTESGGEGRNLQFCNTLINFDVPWNPMTIEQRIGRIDRIGQQRTVFVFNLVTRGTLEQEILHLLEEKIAMFELVVGEVGAILGNLGEDRDFGDLVLEAWLKTTESTRTNAFDSIGIQLEDARRRHEGVKALDQALFGEDFETA